MTNRTYSRREALRSGAALASLASLQAALPAWMPRLAFAPRYQNPRGDVLVVVFLRGGADSLNMIVPHGEDAYYDARPQLAIARPDTSGGDPKALDLDGFFGLHPALAPLLPVFQGGGISAVHATGSPHPTRSHFEAMDYMERGTPGDYDLSSGWVGRHLATIGDNGSPIRAVGWGTAAQVALRGPIHPVALQSIADFHLGGDQQLAQRLLTPLDQLYALGDDDLYAAASATRDALDVIGAVDINGYVPQNGAQYPDEPFAFALKQTAALIRAEAGLEAAAVDLGGWDTHVNQGGAQGQHAGLLTNLANGLAAFHTDMGPEMNRVTVIVMSEFGRRLVENGGGGTDHGHGGALLAMSGNLSTGPVLANWPGLAPDALDNGDLAITIDYRDVLTELLTKRLRNAQTGDVFPDHTPGDVGLFRA